LHWHKKNGRHNLPWQTQNSAYHIWLSEIMLQQTQVTTVIPYFNKFISVFPSIARVAAADLDEILKLWAGLGYYARARNLHKTARILVAKYNAQIPANFDGLVSLPGIGRSTAGAILALAFNQRQPILDGNVKRVLTRYAGIDGWPGVKKVENKLWVLAEKMMPQKHVASYTQAIMDLGSLVCVRKNPLCMQCPVSRQCAAKKLNLTDQLPTPKAKKDIPRRDTVMLIFESKNGTVLLEKRPLRGIWGGLWSLPEFASTEEATHWCSKTFGKTFNLLGHLDTYSHRFTHYQLDIIPLHVRANKSCDYNLDKEEFAWCDTGTQKHAVATPIKNLIQTIS